MIIVSIFLGFERQVIHLEHTHFNSEKLRNRRSTNYNNESHTNLPKEFYYNLEAFKQTFLLNFTLDSSFISPYLIVQKENISWIESPYFSALRPSNSSFYARANSCLYTGTVNKEDFATTAGVANLCTSNGMVSLDICPVSMIVCDAFSLGLNCD